MKQIKDIVNAVNLNEEFYQSQFKDENWGEDKNILFLNPQLSGKELYRTFLPFIYLHNGKFSTALSGVNKYEPREQLLNFRFRLDYYALDWADFIVIPFTAQNLTLGENSLYEVIRLNNPNCKIVYCVDFNFYELSPLHPYKDIFTDQAIQNVEDNIWFADLCFITNREFSDYLVSRITNLGKGRLSNVGTKVIIVTVPIFLDSSLLMSNVDYDAQEPIKMSAETKYDPQTEQHLENVEQASAETQKNANKISVKKTDGNWVVQRGNYIKPIAVLSDKKEAVKKAKEYLKVGCDIYIYKVNGELQTHILYKNNIKQND